MSISGPHTLVKRIQNKFYPSEEAFALDLARVLNFELKELVKAGAQQLQIDEPYYSGFPEDLPWALKAINTLIDGVTVPVTLHICYGNRYGKPSFEGSYRYLFPAILDTKISAVSLEFARRGEEDLQLFKEYDVPFQLGLGVIDVKSQEVESAALVADRIRRALEVVPAEKLVINPDCGCVRLPRDVAFNKLAAMVEGHEDRAEGTRHDERTVRAGQRACRAAAVARVLLHGRARRLGDEARRGSARDGGQDGRGAADRRDRRHQLRRRRAPGTTRCALPPASRRCGLTPNIHLTCVGQDRKGIANTLATLESLRIHNTFCISGDWPKNSPTPPVFDVDSVQLAGAGGRAAAEARHAVPHLVRGLAVQVPARGLPLSVPEAREEDCRRRQHGDHPGRAGTPRSSSS